MAKVKIVQVAVAFDNDGNDGSEYLDDKGRVWYQTGHWDNPNDRENRKWVNEWKQVELPDEPEV